MNTPTLLQFPSGDEATLDEWKEEPQASAPVHDDRFIEWEARRSFMTLIGHLGFASTQGGRHE